jgi:DnaK suppressor protein
MSDVPGQPFDATLSPEFRDRLLRARHALLGTVARTDAEMADLESREPGDPIDRASAASTTLLASRLAGQDKRELDEIAEALRRLAAGGFGTCEACRGSIGLARLRAVPATRFCLACQTSQEAAR